MAQTDFRIELFQVAVDTEDLSRNAEKIAGFIGSSTADLCVFPEAVSSGFSYRQLNEIAAFNRDFLGAVGQEAARRQVSVILPLLVMEDERFFNRTHGIGPDGRALGHYDKIHLIGLLNEDRFLSPGEKPAAIRVPGATGTLQVGLATCYDLRFPELFRILVREAPPDIFILPAMWPVERKKHFSILIRARAVENLTPFLACNAVGACGKMTLCGESMVCDEKGETVLLASSDTEERLVWRLNTDRARNWRREFPALRDIRLLKDL